MINNLDNPVQRKNSTGNLAEEQGNVNGIDLLEEVLASTAGQPHTLLYRSFQEAVGVDENYRETTP